MKFGKALSKLSVKSKNYIKANGADIAIKAGMALVAGGTVLAISKSRKSVEIVDDLKDELEDLHYVKENGYIAINEDTNAIVDMSDAEYKKSVAKAYGMALWRFVKLYFDVVIVEGVGLVLIAKGNSKHKLDKMELTGALATFKTAYDKLYERIEAKYGKDEALKLKYGVEEKIYEDTEVDAKGKTKKVKEKVNVVKSDLEDYSPYAKFFDASSKYYEKSAEYNLFFIKSIESYANQKLEQNRIVFLNEIYEALGIPQTQAGQKVGWSLDNPNSDHKISFGIYDGVHKANADFVNGYEPTIILDFNVDGEILNYIPMKV